MGQGLEEYDAVHFLAKIILGNSSFKMIKNFKT
jgi:hypothetical protein